MKTTTKNVQNQLVAAKFLLMDAESWTKGSWAKTEKGHVTQHFMNNAACFCLDGAVKAVRDKKLGNNEATRNVLNLVATMLDPDSMGSVISFNDKTETTHENIHEALDLAISLTEEF